MKWYKKNGVADIIYYWFSTVYVIKTSVLDLQQAPEDSELAPSV